MYHVLNNKRFRNMVLIQTKRTNFFYLKIVNEKSVKIYFLKGLKQFDEK